MILFGYLAIRVSSTMLRVPRNILMPAILMFCVVGSYAINKSDFDVGTMLAAGILGHFFAVNGIPVAPVVLRPENCPWSHPRAKLDGEQDQERLGSYAALHPADRGDPGVAHQPHLGAAVPSCPRAVLARPRDCGLMAHEAAWLQNFAVPENDFRGRRLAVRRAQRGDR
jgi:hypothetical protein